MSHHTIVIASESFYPVISGVSVMSERLAHYLAQQGHKVVVITPSRNRSAYTEHRRGYTIQRIPSWPNPFRKGLRFTMFPKRAVAEILDKIKPDLVHIHDPALTSQAVADYGKEKGIPVVVTHHFTYDFVLAYFPKLKPLHPQFRTLMEHSFAELYNTCDVLTVPTESMQKAIKGMDLSIPIKVISNGVDTERFGKQISTAPLRKKYQLPDAPIILSVGRLDPEKEADTLIKALGSVHKKDVSFHAVIVGNGNSKEELHQLAESLDLLERITWIDRVDNTSSLLPQLYHAGEIFCIPSPIETESIVTMEAMAAGMPIVAAKRGALQELVEDGKNGYLLTPGNDKAWGEAIIKLLTSSQTREQMGEQSKKRIQSRAMRYSFEAFEGLYQELLRGNK